MSHLADSFRGKLLLLILDKFVIGAIIALAFVCYERYKTEETRKYEEKRSEIQLQFERARLLKEFLPIIQNSDTNPVTSSYLLHSAILTNSLNADAAFDIGRDFLYGKLSENRYKEIVSATLPESIGAFARRGVQIAKEWHSALGSFPHLDASFNPLSGIEDLPKEASSIIKEARLYRDLLYDNLTAFDNFESLELLQEDQIRDNLFGLFVLLQTSDFQKARKLSQRPENVLQLLGMIVRLWQRGGKDQEAESYLEAQFEEAGKSKERLHRAMVLVALLRWISAKEDGLKSSAFARILGKIAVGSLPQIGITAAEGGSVYWLRWNAAEALYLAKDQAANSVPIIVQFLESFRDRLAMAESRDQLREVSNRYHSGKIVRVLISVLGNVPTNEAKRTLQVLLKLEDDRLRHFPLLKENLQHALE